MGCRGVDIDFIMLKLTKKTKKLTLNALIATKVVCFSCLLKCLRSLYGKQCGPRSDAPIGAVCSGITLFASILNSSVMLGNYLQQTTSADDIFRYIFFLGALGVKRYLTCSVVNVNNKGADQTVRMRRLVCAFVVRKQQSQGFSKEAHVMLKPCHRLYHVEAHEK